MVTPRSHLNLKLLPHLTEKFPSYAVLLGMPPSTLLGFLVRNDSIRRNTALAALPPSKKLNRTSLGCSLRAALRKLAVRRAREQNLTLNAYLEALIDAHLARKPADFTIYLAKK